MIKISLIAFKDKWRGQQDGSEIPITCSFYSEELPNLGVDRAYTMMKNCEVRHDSMYTILDADMSTELPEMFI